MGVASAGASSLTISAGTPCRERRVAGDDRAAAEVFASAAEVFDAIGASLDARLAQGDAPAPTLPAGLTEREAEVLRLVAAGLSNAEAAEQLYLSRRTVEQHMRSIFNKLGVSSRNAATRFAIEHGLA